MARQNPQFAPMAIGIATSDRADGKRPGVDQFLHPVSGTIAELGFRRCVNARVRSGLHRAAGDPVIFLLSGFQATRC